MRNNRTKYDKNHLHHKPKFLVLLNKTRISPLENYQLIDKYNTAGPRYTSYPTVPDWDLEQFSPEKYLNGIRNTDKSISLYIHLPYCESLCTFCACHKHITKNHGVEESYIEALLREWELYNKVIGAKIKISEIHLGGGTPSFFKPENLKILIEGILDGTEVNAIHEFGFEGHPLNTTLDHLKTLFDLGFRRVSFGIQDYDPKVQVAIHRVQHYEQVEKVTNWAREIGYESVSHDLVYGLPFQSTESVKDTISKTLTLMPDRISFYSYAHVPWIKGNGQRGFSEENLPDGKAKRALYDTGKSLFEKAGYEEIGMDHFALKKDNLLIAQKNGTLHRNFMGYTTQSGELLLGLGVSAISDSALAFAQNKKDIKAYQEDLANGIFPILKGHILTNKDQEIREIILDIMCNLKAIWTDKLISENPDIFNELVEMEKDGILNLNGNSLIVNPEAKVFLRNIAMIFDERLKLREAGERVFSKTI